MTNDLLHRAQHLWTGLAGVSGAAFPSPGTATVLVSPDSGLCPPGWVGLITLDGATLATAPDERRAALVRAALRTAPDAASDPAHLRAALPTTRLLGPATLAYLAPDALTPAGTTAPAGRLHQLPPHTLNLQQPGEPAPRAHRLPPEETALPQPTPRLHQLPLDHPALRQFTDRVPAAPTAAASAPLQLRQLPPDHPALRRFADLVPSADRDEAGLDEITSPAFAVTEGSTVLAACGYRTWPFATAQFGVLTAPPHRGRGLAATAATAAARHALAAGLLPQWRARPAASRRVARRIGFQELGTQLSIEVP
ncbi:GNAT family N-acetyltransferase [Kitasatospora sp. NPDC088134]|uniref:GNAT family N-acetyltransferase n=1 Tax=Kitasatospora sp. NPDC088134 TaxID=3364071 RepID=UPI003801170A